MYKVLPTPLEYDLPSNFKGLSPGKVRCLDLDVESTPNSPFSSLELRLPTFNARLRDNNTLTSRIFVTFGCSLGEACHRIYDREQEGFRLLKSISERSVPNPHETIYTKMLRRSLTGSLRAVSMISSFKERVGERAARSNDGAEAIPSNRTIPSNLNEEVRPPPPELDRDIDLYAVGPVFNEPDANFQLLLRPRSSAGLHPLFNLPLSVRRKIYAYCIPPSDRKVTLSPHFATKACFEDEYFVSPWDLLDSVSGATSASRIMRDELMTYFWTEFHFHVTLHPFSGPAFSPLSHVWLLEYLDKIQHLTLEADLTRFGGSQMKYAPQFGYDTEKMENLLVDIVTGLFNREDGATMAELHLMCRRYRGDRPVDESDLYDCGPNVPYCPEEAAYLCDALCGLRGRLQYLRISGFVESYTELLLCSVFGNGDTLPDFRIPVDDAWPPLPEQSAGRYKYRPSSTATTSEYQLKLNRTRSFTEDMHKEILRFGSPDYARSFFTADDNQSLVGNDSAPKNLFVFADDNRILVKEDTQSTSPTQETGNPQLELSEDLKDTLLFNPQALPLTTSPSSQLVEHLQCNKRYQFLPLIDQAVINMLHKSEDPKYFPPIPLIITPHPSFVFSNDTHASAGIVRRLQDLPPPPSYSEAVQSHQSATPKNDLVFHNEETFITRRPVTPTLSSAIAVTRPPSTPVQSPRLLPIPPRTSPPRSPNTMNDLNEQDPAFLRTLNALRSIESAPKTTSNSGSSLLPDSNTGNMENADIPDCCVSSLSQTKSEGQKHRYKRFVDKLRRHS
ncbi:hypothetical protein B7494_g530 [Chlorociboria aeruginascens]|nr:hypothetical protein B7494_g530 [Chlorociboria aeruginascens]